MQKLTRNDLYGLEQYASARQEFRARVMAHKKNRQLLLGGNATLYFEDRLTIQYQIQEMLRAERIFESAGINEELEAYNPLIPDGSGALLPLGNYTLTLQPAPDGELPAAFVDNGGPLEVQGTLRLDATRSYTIDALIEPRAGAPESLVEGLKFMTTDPDAEGRRRLNLTGSL